MATDRTLDDDLRGLDALDTPRVESRSRSAAMWSAAWPKLLAITLALATWQVVVWSGWKPTYVLPGPQEVLSRLGTELTNSTFYRAVSVTLQRAVTGFALAAVLGSLLGLAVSQSRILRRGIGSLITGLQTMPSITWFPFAILVFKLSEAAILFVIVLGAGPAIANGLISGVDHIPPILLRAGRVLGARGLASWRHVIFPAALPGYVAGLKQGWAFAWRSLMAGELLVIIASRPSIGVRLKFAHEMADAAGLMAMMLVVLFIGIAMDGLVFGTIERHVRRNRGLLSAGD